MNYFDLYSSYPDHTITNAWDSQVKEANQFPWIAETLDQRGNELFSLFAACYAELRALPRGARRALQRQLACSSDLAAILPEYLQQGGRRLQHRMAWSLAGAALLLALGQGVATAATITVTTNNPNAAADGQCSLIEAIVNANNDAATHADCAAGSGADTIVLPANANVTLTSMLDYRGLPLIGSRITIEGNEATIARQANAPFFQLMAVSNSGDLTLKQVTLSGGFSQGSHRGGGVGNYGTLTIEDSTISGNRASINGGGVANFGTLRIKNSVLSDNASQYGGAGLSNYGTATIENSTISSNTDNYTGGGVENFGTLTIENSTISGNTAVNGGGVYNLAGSITITNSTISGNAADQGGGLVNRGITGSPYDCQFINCSPGTITLNRSLIAGNQAAAAAEVESTSIVTASNFNLFGFNGNAGVTGFTPGPTDIVPSVSLANILGPLQNSGGPTETHALIAGSPAIDAGDPGGCRTNPKTLLLNDQRGFARHVDGNSDGTIRCDIGAFEFGAEFAPIPLAIGATTLATGEAGVSFTSDLMIAGGVAPYIVSITNGKLPAGLSLGNDGIISGILSPTAKNARITVRITDSVNESITKTFTITVLKTVRVAEKAKTGRLGKNYSTSLKTKGGLAPFNWSITAGALPPGLNFNTATGALTGIPTQAGEFPLTVQVTDALGGVDAENLTLKIR